jgi:LmbE family N-acetylglucosaminyl deacetylase
MINMMFNRETDSPFRVLALGAHSDDIEIGCGGSMLRLLSEIDDVEVFWIVFSGNQQRSLEAQQSAEQFLSGAAQKHIRIENFRDGFFPYDGGEIKEYFESLKPNYEPDLIFTHHREDFHQDHRLISELTWNTFRNHFILEYEIIKYDGDIDRPNFYFKLDHEICRDKIRLLMDCFKTQTSKPWFTEDTLYAIMRLRGLEINSPGKFAEGFFSRKVSI